MSRLLPQPQQQGAVSPHVRDLPPAGAHASTASSPARAERASATAARRAPRLRNEPLTPAMTRRLPAATDDPSRPPPVPCSAIQLRQTRSGNRMHDRRPAAPGAGGRAAAHASLRTAPPARGGPKGRRHLPRERCRAARPRTSPGPPGRIPCCPQRCLSTPVPLRLRACFTPARYQGAMTCGTRVM